MLLKNMS